MYNKPYIMVILYIQHHIIIFIIKFNFLLIMRLYTLIILLTYLKKYQ